MIPFHTSDRLLTIAQFRIDAKSPLSKAVALEASDTLKIVLTTTENKKPKRPHQAFLTVTDAASGLEEAFPFSLKENGKGKIEVVRDKSMSTDQYSC
jgi:oligosaccharyltransferase complex subunit delta (ribophorin II)